MTFGSAIKKDRVGSQVAVEQPRMDFIAQTAGNGQLRTFDARSNLRLNVRFQIRSSHSVANGR